MTISTKAQDKKLYSVGGYSGSRFAYADTLAEARKAGEEIARKEAGRGKWNVWYIPVSIRKADSKPPYRYYGKPILTMFVPVRGTGVAASTVLAKMKEREGVSPFKWIKGGSMGQRW